VSTALLTGISGQTGSYLCEQLLEQGWRVVGIVRDADDLRPALQERSPQAELLTGDLTDDARMRSIVLEVEPDAIFNLGGISSVAASWSDPGTTARVTGVGGASMLAAAAELRERTGRRVGFVQASSAEMFGEAADIPQTEQTVVRPVNPYGAAKAYVHHLVGVYRGAGLEASSVILYNHESPRRPESFVTRKITMGVARIAHGLAEDLVLGSLESQRDWGWAPDYARALALAAVGEPGDYIVATGEVHTVGDFVEAAFAAAGIDNWQERVKVDQRFVRPREAPTLVGDAGHIRDTLGWVPSVGFDELVQRMVAHDLELVAGSPTPPQAERLE
jgi:GDPmannose 4,6-dehydratase